MANQRKSGASRADHGRRKRADDAGGEVVEFTLVSVLLVILVGALLQLALALHVRNTLISCAAEGARYAAAEDRSLADGRERAVDLAEASFGGYPVEAEVSMSVMEGDPVVVVSLAAPVPVVGLWGFGHIRVEARAVEEVDRG